MKKSWFVIAAAIPMVVIGSVAVWQLSGSDGRRVGAIGAADEPVALMWRGDWNAEAEYAPGHVVSLKDASYVAQQVNKGSMPDSWCPDDCMWARMGQGTQGPQGPKGDAGPVGPKGVSVTSAVEPAGTKCANGGSKFTAANGVTYACNGLTTTSIPAGKSVIVSKELNSAGYSGNWAGLETNPPGGTILVWAKITRWGPHPDNPSAYSIRCFLSSPGSTAEYASTPSLTAKANQPATLEIGNVDAFPAGGASISVPPSTEIVLRCVTTAPFRQQFEQLTFFALAPA